MLVAGHVVKRDERLVGLDLEHLRGKARDAWGPGDNGWPEAVSCNRPRGGCG
ncbi:MAG: hypothetical protein ACRDT2_02605 [Natronosporangium sp.]